MKQRSAQALVLYAMDLEPHLGPFPIEAARDAFLKEEPWQPVRRLLERLAATRDWGEVIVAANLCFEPVVGMLLRRELGIRAAAANGDTVTPTLARAASSEWSWVRGWTAEFVQFLAHDSRYGSSNRSVVAGWVDEWLPRARRAALALAPVANSVGVDVERALVQMPSYATATPPRAPASARPEVAASRQLPPPSDGSFNCVGIVMAKSAEGDAVAGILGRREGVVVREQPAFWDIRAHERLVVAYDEVSCELGYEIDAYSIQHEMSTHYGRLVATDEALMLFSDPTEAMEHLMA